MVHYEAHITQLYKTIAIFLDDEDIQQLILGNTYIAIINYINPKIVKSENIYIKWLYNIYC